MFLKDRIAELIREKNHQTDNLNRDIIIVQTYFGLGNLSIPTLEAIADIYEITRERVRQIIEDKFISRINIGDLGIVTNISEEFYKKEIHRVSELFEELRILGYVDGVISLKGVLNLVRLFGCAIDYDIYNPDLEEATLRDYELCEELFLATKTKRDVLKGKLREIKSFPGMVGICNLSEVFEHINIQNIDRKYLSDILISSKDSWVYQINETEQWFLFENRNNIIINSLAKIKNIVDNIEVKTLADVIKSTITKRSSIFQRPNENIIEEYFKNSKFIVIKGRYAYFDVEPIELTDLEKEILKLFINTGVKKFSYTDLWKYIGPHYSKVYFDKCVYHSPLIFVDRSNGRSNFEFYLVSEYSRKESEGEDEFDKYGVYKNRLSGLYGETDMPRVERSRAEQSILRDWLFSGKRFERCAICNREFSIESLVAAHKKKRCQCSEGERTDPHIVMPLCVFGCDNMYERELIVIVDGKVKTNKEEQLSVTELEYLESIDNNILNEKWVQGNKNYFKREFHSTLETDEHNP